MAIDWFLIAYIGAPLSFLILEKPFGLVSLVRDYLNRLWLIREGFSVYNLMSFFVLLGVWLYFLAPIPQLLSQGNIFIELYTNGHWMSWIGLIAVMTVFGYFDIIKGVYIAGFIYSIHELAWITGAGIYNGMLWSIYVHYAPIMVVMTLLILGYFLAYRGLPKYKEVLIVVVIIVFDILWMMAGFHSTVENWMTPPATMYYANPIVNVIEVLSWFLPAMVALL